MIQGAVIRVIGVVLGLFVIFSVVSPVAGGLDELYLHSIDSCNFGDESNPERALIIGTNSEWASTSDADPDDVNWNNADDRRELIEGGSGNRDIVTITDTLVVGNSDNTFNSTIGLQVLPNSYMSQSFTTGDDPLFNKLDIYLSSSTTYTFKVSVHNDNGSGNAATSTAALVTFHVANNTDIPSSPVGKKTLSVNSITPLVANTQYFLVFQAGDIDPSEKVSQNTEIALRRFDGTDKNDEHPDSLPEWSIGNGTDSADLDSTTWSSVGSLTAVDFFKEESATVTVQVTDGSCALSAGDELLDNTVWTSANGDVDFLVSGGDAAIIDTISVSGLQIDPFWAEPAGLFDEQPQLVELLATIAALALPLGALGAVVFFGNTISVATGTSGVSSQIIAVITIVVVILVIVEVFGQFIVYLDNAFEVIDKDRFAVYDNGLGTLAETITSFWGILAFASVLPIGFSLFRTYQSGGGIAGFGGGGRGV